MSREVESWARQQKTGNPVRKAVLVALANQADSLGQNCFPSINFLAEEVEVDPRTIQRRLKELKAMQLIDWGVRLRADGSQSSNCYTFIGYVPPRLSHRPAPTPLKGGGKMPGGAKLPSLGDASATGPHDTVVTPRTPDELPFPPTAEDKSPAVSPPKGGEPPVDDQQEVEEPRARRGTRLPEDWSPPPIDTLPQTVQAVVAQWPKGAYEFVAAGFAGYWTAENGRRASKRNWRAAWVKWLTAEGVRVLAMARNGIKFFSGTVKLADDEALADLERLRSSEDECVAKLRDHLRKDLGAQTYDGWLRPTVIGIHPGHLTDWYVNVICPSAFMADWVERNFKPTITAMACRILETDSLTIQFEIVSDR